MRAATIGTTGAHAERAPLGTMTEQQRDIVKAHILANWREFPPKGVPPRAELPTDAEARVICLLLCRRADEGKLDHAESLLLSAIGIDLVRRY